jgi:hypothetical protein
MNDHGYEQLTDEGKEKILEFCKKLCIKKEDLDKEISDYIEYVDKKDIRLITFLFTNCICIHLNGIQDSHIRQDIIYQLLITLEAFVQTLCDKYDN